jgi:hypothetical protein
MKKMMLLATVLVLALGATAQQSTSGSSHVILPSACASSNGITRLWPPDPCVAANTNGNAASQVGSHVEPGSHAVNPQPIPPGPTTFGPWAQLLLGKLLR